MFRRAFTRALALSAATAMPGVRTVFARPLPPADLDPDPRPISPDNPRIWPAVTRYQPLLLGAVDAFRAPDRAAEAGVQCQRIMVRLECDPASRPRRMVLRLSQRGDRQPRTVFRAAPAADLGRHERQGKRLVLRRRSPTTIRAGSSTQRASSTT